MGAVEARRERRRHEQADTTAGLPPRCGDGLLTPAAGGGPTPREREVAGGGDRLAHEARSGEAADRGRSRRDDGAGGQHDRRDREHRDLVPLPARAEDLDVEDEGGEAQDDHEREEGHGERQVRKRPVEQEPEERLGEQREPHGEHDSERDRGRAPVTREQAAPGPLVRVGVAVEAPAECLRREQGRVRRPQERAVETGEPERADEADREQVRLSLEDDRERGEREGELGAEERPDDVTGALWKAAHEDRPRHGAARSPERERDERPGERRSGEAADDRDRHDHDRLGGRDGALDPQPARRVHRARIAVRERERERERRGEQEDRVVPAEAGAPEDDVEEALRRVDDVLRLFAAI